MEFLVPIFEYTSKPFSNYEGPYTIRTPNRKSLKVYFSETFGDGWELLVGKSLGAKAVVDKVQVLGLGLR